MLFVGIIAAGVIALSVMLQVLLRKEAINSQEQDNIRFFSSTISNLDSNDQEIKALAETFNDNNTIMVSDLVKAYSGNNYKKLESMSPEDQSELLSDSNENMEDCAWMLIVNRDGDIIISSYAENNGLNVIDDGDIDITVEDFYELCDGKVETIIVDNPYVEELEDLGKKMYLYCRPIEGTYSTEGGTKYILLAFFSTILDAAESRMGDLSAWLNGSTIGNNGTVFMVDAALDRVSYGLLEGEDKTGEKASEIGFSSEVLQDGYTGSIEIGGVDYYVSVRAYSSKLYGNDNFLIAAIPVRDMHGLSLSVTIWNVCLFLIAVVLVLAYASYVRSEALKKGDDLRGIRLFSKKEREIILSRSLANKILPIVFTMALLVFGASFYFQALMKLSDVFSDSVAIDEEISSDVKESKSLREDFLYYYEMQYRSRAKLISFIVSLDADEYLDFEKESGSINFSGNIDANGKRVVVKDEYNNNMLTINNSKKLMELRDSNNVENIYLISDKGVTLATSSNFWNFSLSNDPADQSYEFWDILYGKKDVIVQDAMENDEGRQSQFIGCTLYYYTCLDDDGNTKYVSYTEYINQEQNDTDKEKEITRHRGLLQIELDPEEEGSTMESSKPSYILSNTIVANNGFLIGLEYDEEKEDYVVFYSSLPDFEDMTASEMGLSQNDFMDNAHSFQTISGMRFLESLREAGDYFIATAIPLDSLYAGSFQTALFCALFSFVVFFCLSFFLLFIGEMDAGGLFREETDPLAIFGYLKPSKKWKNSSANRKFEMLIKNCLIVLGVVFIAAVIYETKRFGSNSAIVYILWGQWDRGIHIFSLSACFVIIIVSAALFKLFEHIVKLIAAVFGNRVVTIIKLSLSLIKTALAMIVLLYCLYLMGIDATRLLASAGIMSVVVGLGAQSLVSDLLAGIFLVMEASIHVGDYVLINDVRGKIVEIGLRTTRYEDINQNIRIVCNNEMKSFVNMSMKYSVVFFRIPVPYGMDYVWIRKLLDEEFLKLYEEHRFLKAIPACLGIEEFSESSVDLNIRFMCDEADRLNVQRFMHDEIMRILTENGIQIPFNQLDVHFFRELSKGFGDEEKHNI